MLTAKVLTSAEIRALLRRDPNELAPKFRRALTRTIERCRAIPPSRQFPAGLDVMLYEGVRTEAVQQAYWQLGRDEFGNVVDPKKIVTKARSAMGSWHFYGLAGDVVSESQWWKFGDSDHADKDELEWIRAVAAIAKEEGLDWGGDWPMGDYPHLQWGRLRSSPSERARELYRIGKTHEEGLIRVWREVGAIETVTIRVP